MFKTMPDRELLAYIAGCHRSREYDAYFEAATLEANNRGLSAIARATGE